MKKPFSLLSGRPSGQTLGEFAQVSAVFFLLLFGIVQMGIAVYRYNTVCMAAREATRYAAVHSPTSANPAGSGGFPTVQQFAANFAPSFLTAGNVSVNYPADASPNLHNQNDALVTVSYSYTMLKMPFMSPVALTLSSTSKMLVSQ